MGEEALPRPSRKSGIEKLWEAILATSRVTEDPIAAWQAHNQDLHDRCAYLNSLHIRELHYKPPTARIFMSA